MALTQEEIETIMSLKDEMTPGLKKAEDGLSGFQKTALGVFGAVGATIASWGGAALATAVSFDNAMDKIRIGTGATGDELKAFGDSTRAVLAQVPDSLDTVSTAITTLAQRTGLEGGPALDALSTQFLTLSRLTKSEVGPTIESATGAFNVWGISVANQGAALDKLLVVNQKTGTSVGQLTGSLQAMAPIFKTLNIGFDESAALIGKWEQQGINAGTMLAGLRKATATFAQAGVDASVGVQQAIEKIKGLGSTSEATGLAIQVFGSRAGVQMRDAILSGALAVDDLVTAMQDSQGAIQSAAKDTDDYAEKWAILKNKLELALEPLGKTLFEALNRLTPFLESGVKWIGEMSDKLLGLLDPSSKVAVAFDVITGVLSTLVAEIMPSVISSFTQFKSFISDVAADISSKMPREIDIFKALGDTLNWVATQVLPVLLDAVTGVVGLAVEMFGDLWKIGGQIVDLFGRLDVKVGDLGPVFAGFLTAAKGVWDILVLLAEVVITIIDRFGLLQGAVAIVRELGRIAEVTGKALSWLADQIRFILEASGNLDPKLRPASKAISDLGGVSTEASKRVTQLQTDLLVLAKTQAVQGLVGQLSAAAEAMSEAGTLTSDAVNKIGASALQAQQNGAVLTPTLQAIVTETQRATVGTIAFVGPLKAMGQAATDTKGSVDATADVLGKVGPAGKEAGKSLKDVADLLDQIKGIGADPFELQLDLIKQVGPNVVDLKKNYDDWIATLKSMPTAPFQMQLSLLKDVGGEVIDVAKEYQAWLERTKEIGPTLNQNTQEGVSALKKLGDALKNTLGDLNSVFKAAFEGGGGVGGAIQSLATNLTANLLKTIPIVGEFISQFSGAIVTGVKKLFGAVSAEVKKARDDQEKFFTDLRKNATQAQFDAAKSSEVAIVVARDALLSIGKTAADAEQIVRQLYNTDNPKAFAAATAEVTAALDLQKQALAAMPGLIDQITGGLNAISAGTVGTFDDIALAVSGASDAMLSLLDKQDQLKSKIDELNKQDHLTPAQQLQLAQWNKDLVDVTAQIAALSAQQDATAKQWDDIAKNGQDAFDRVGRLAVVAFSAAIAGGKGFGEAIDAIGPTLDDLTKAHNEWGFEASGTLATLLKYKQFADDNKALVGTIDGVNKMLSGLNNTGLLTQETFDDLTAITVDTFRKMVEGGQSADEATRAMQPALQKIWEAHKDNKLAVTDEEQALLDLAETNGTVGDNMRGVQEQTLLVLQHIAEILEKTIPQALADLPSEKTIQVHTRFDTQGQPSAGIAPPDVPSAQIGGHVRRAGLVLVHAGETIAPGRGAGITPLGEVAAATDYSSDMLSTLDDIKRLLRKLPTQMVAAAAVVQK